MSKKKFKSLEDAFAKIRKDKFYITSITEMTRDVWSACLRPAGATTTSYGQGTTALGALQAAYDNRTREDAWNRSPPPPTKKKVIKKKSGIKRSSLF